MISGRGGEGRGGREGVNLTLAFLCLHSLQAVNVFGAWGRMRESLFEAAGTTGSLRPGRGSKGRMLVYDPETHIGMGMPSTGIHWSSGMLQWCMAVLYFQTYV